LSYYKDYKSVLIKNILKIKKNKQDNLNKLFNNKDKNKDKEKIKTKNFNNDNNDKSIKLNDKNIDKLSNILDKDKVFIILLGGVEKLDYNVQELNKIKSNYSLKRIYTIYNYLYYFIIKYSSYFKDYNLKYDSIKDLIEKQDSWENKTNKLLNDFIEILLSVLNKYNNKKDDYEYIKELILQILEFDELLTNYNYGEVRNLLKKGNNEIEMLLDDDKAIEHDIDDNKQNYDSVFDSSLFESED
jgi:hypothetical protein